MHRPIYPVRLALLLVFEVHSFTQICDKKARGSKIFSTRTAYDEVRHKELKLEEIPGCEVRTFYSLNRHGTRYPGGDEIQGMEKELPSLRDSIVANAHHAGYLCANQVSALRQWQPLFSPELHLQNTQAGLQEMAELGSRWRYRFPTFFGHSNHELDIRCGNLTRLHQSAAHLYSGIFPEKSWKLQACKSVPAEEDRLLLYLDNCARYISSRIRRDDPEKVQTTLYDQSPAVLGMLARLHARLALPLGTINLTLATHMYEACRFEHAVYRYAPWCEVFASSDLETLVYRQDMKYYWRYGHGRSINSQPSCVLLNDLVSSISNSVIGPGSQKKKKVIIRMGSSRSILPLLVRMGLFQDDNHLRTNNSRLNVRRKWQLGVVNPFASNLVVVHYSCQTGHKIRTFLNERAIRPPGCKSYWCPAEEFFSQWAKTAAECDFDEICSDANLSLSNYRFDMHHL